MKFVTRKRKVFKVTNWAKPASHLWRSSHGPINIGANDDCTCWDGWIENVSVAFGETSWLGRHYEQDSEKDETG